MGHPNPIYWFRLKDRIKRRAGDVCEYCSLRPYYALHHRTYARYGQEDEADVMLVCNICHCAIHGLLSSVAGRFPQSIVIRRDSLAARGDDGLSMNEIWKDYLGYLCVYCGRGPLDYFDDCMNCGAPNEIHCRTCGSRLAGDDCLACEDAFDDIMAEIAREEMQDDEPSGLISTTT